MGGVDVTAAQIARARLFDASDSAALEAANALDEAAAYSGGIGDAVVVSSGTVERAVEDNLAARPMPYGLSSWEVAEGPGRPRPHGRGRSAGRAEPADDRWSARGAREVGDHHRRVTRPGTASVTSMTRVEPLDPSRHDRSQFVSGEPMLDDWIRRFAGQAARRDGARTYVVCDGPRVIGYYSVCAFQVERDVAPPWTRIGGHPVPAILLARLAVDQVGSGTRLGQWLCSMRCRSPHPSLSGSAPASWWCHALHEQAATFALRLPVSTASEPVSQRTLRPPRCQGVRR